jgi:alpha-L-rhamnosidase
MIWNAKWITPKEPMGTVAPEFCREFACKALLQSATLSVTAMGVYEVMFNGSRVSNYVLAPGWTVYEKRHQYQ